MHRLFPFRSHPSFLLPYCLPGFPTDLAIPDRPAIQTGTRVIRPEAGVMPCPGHARPCASPKARHRAQTQRGHPFLSRRSRGADKA